MSVNIIHLFETLQPETAPRHTLHTNMYGATKERKMTGKRTATVGITRSV